MAASPRTPPFRTDFAPIPGKAETLAPGVARIVAPNASPYTFTGTNSYLIGHERPILLDPGPDDAAHSDALARAIAGRPLAAIVLTHTHTDHCALARKAAERFKAPLVFAGRHRLSRPRHPLEFDPFARAGVYALTPDRTVAAGASIETADAALRVVATPGHCANHIALALEDSPYLFSGDHVMGWSSTLIAPPDGDLADYFDSLATLLARPETIYLPGHGDVIAEGPAMTRALQAHREMRNGQIRAALRDGPKTLATLTRAIYPDLSGRRALAGRRTLLSHVEYLAARGRVELAFRPFGLSRIRLSDAEDGGR